MFTKIKQILTDIKENAIKRYPVTTIAILLGTILGTFLWDTSYEDHRFLYRLMAAAFIFSVQALFLEELECKKKMLQIGGFLVAAFLAFAFVWILSSERSFGNISADTICDWTTRILTCYLLWTFVVSLYHMQKRSGKDFSNYCTIVFGSAMKMTLVYGIFALGVALIMLIFNALIFETDSFLVRLELFLAGGIYVPGMIQAISDTEKKISRFYELVIKFVLMPLLLASFVIVYLYIIKLIVTFDLPKNQVYLILVHLFGIGLPIWTMGSIFQEHIMGKIAKWMPYAFTPFLLLQLVCLGLRIGQYGLTASRYLGCFMIGFEILYLLLNGLLQKKLLDKIFLILIAFVTVYVLVPFLRYDDMVYLTQKSCLKQFLSEANPDVSTYSKEQICRLKGAHSMVERSESGKTYLKTLSNAEQDWIEEMVSQVDEYYFDKSYMIHGYWEQHSVSVKEYEQISVVSGETRKRELLRDFPLKSNGEDLATISLEDYVQAAIAFYKENEGEYVDMSVWVRDYGPIRDEKGTFLVEGLSIEMDGDDIERVSVNGYYLQ